MRTNKPVQFCETDDKCPDGGYGWVIAFGCFLTHFFIGGFTRSSGIFLIHFQHRYGENYLLTSWPISIASSLMLFLGPVASAVHSLYSARASLMIGGLLMFVGLILTSLADDFYLLFVYYSLIYGVGTALCYTPSLIIVNMYFDKRRSLASGIGTSGVGAGTFALVPIVQYCFNNYEFSGAFLIFAAIAFHMIFVAMLFRPFLTDQRFTKARLLKKAKKEAVSVAETSIDSIDGLCVDNYINKQAFPEQPKCNTKRCVSNSILDIIFPVDKSHKKGSKLFEIVLLKDLSFFMYCISICFFTISYQIIMLFLAPFITSKGFSENDTALVISISGISDTISRILTGLLLDIPRILPIRTIIYNGFLFVVAGITLALPFLQDFWSFAVITSIYQIVTGACVAQKAVAVIDILGMKNLANSLGLLISIQGLGTLIGPPIFGYLKDTYGTYDIGIYVCVGCMMASALLMVASNVFLIINRRSQNIEEPEETDDAHTFITDVL